MIRLFLRVASGLLLSAGLALAQSNPVGQVRHAPSVRGTVEGSLQQVPVEKWPTLDAVPKPTQKDLVKVSSNDQTINWRALRNLTLRSGVGQVAVPAGTYGNFIAEANSGFTLGTAGATAPAVYNFQNLTLNGASKVLVAGPVVINLASGLSASGAMGAVANPAWLTLNIKSGGLTLEGGARFHGEVVVPSGSIIINRGAQLVGGLTAEDLTVNAGGLLRLVTLRAENLPPTVALAAPGGVTSHALPAAITLSATAADADGTVTKVELFRGGAKVGEDVTAPYEFPLPGITAGTYAYSARATDNAGATTESAAITIMVIDPNQAPAITLTAPTDGAILTVPATVTLTATAADVDGSITRVDFFQGATLIVSDTAAPYEATTGALTAGTQVFSAVAVDNNGATAASTTATLTVVNGNEAPTVAITAPADGASYDTPAAFVLTAMAADGDGTVTKVGFFMNGTLLREDFTAPYDAGVKGLEPGTYDFVARVTDNLGVATESTPVRVTIVRVNDAPMVAPQSFATDEDKAVAVTLAATDGEGDAVTFAIVAAPSFGSLTGTAPNLTYTPRVNFNGEDAFTFKASDGSLESPIVTVAITVRPVNDAPTATPGNLTVAEDGSVPVHLAGTDVEGMPLKFAIIDGPEHGALSGRAPDLTYTAASGYHGPDRFVYAAYDGEFISPAAAVTITITSENDAPVAEAGTAVTDENVPVALTLVGKDRDKDALTYTITNAPAHGTLSGTAPDLVYTPAASYHGPDTLVFTVSDGRASSTEVTVALTVRSRNDAPVAQEQAVSTMEDATLLVTLSATDPDAETLTYSVVTQPEHGTLEGEVPKLIYTPAANYHGSDSFAFKASDGTTDSVAATVSITVLPANDQPAAGQLVVSLREDEPAALVLPGTDPDGDALTYTIVIPPVHGALSGTPPNLTYTPEADYFGNDEFVYKVSDGSRDSTPGFVALRIAPVNDAPTGEDITIALKAGTSATFELPSDDVDSEQLTFEIEDMPSHGGLSVLEPSLIYTPAADFAGTDSMTYTVGDGTLVSAIHTVTFAVSAASTEPAASTALAARAASAVNPEPAASPEQAANVAPAANTAPVAEPKELTTEEDVPASITLTGNDAEGDTLAFAIVSPPAHGALSESSSGTYQYVPEPNYSGSDSFTYVAKDATLASEPASVTIAIVPVNDVPVAVEQSLATPEDTAATITLAGSDVDGDALTYAILTNPAHGSLTQVSAGTYSYLPAAGYHGPDAFDFVARDQTSASGPAIVTINVSSVNNAPHASDQTAITDEDTALSLALVATDADGDTLTYLVKNPPTHGTLSGTAPDLVYTPNANYHGPDSFTFTANDGTLSTGTVAVGLTVNSANDTPMAAAQLVITHEDTAVTITLEGSDADGDALAYAISTQPSHGALTEVSAGVYSYQPAADYQGADGFEFVARDQAAESTPATVTLQVTPVNDAPVGADQAVSTNEDTALPLVLGATDADGDALTYAVQTPPEHGTLSGTAPDLVYTPSVNYHGPDSFTFTASDGTLSSPVATVTLTINPDNDAPVAYGQSITATRDVAKVINLAAADVDADQLTYTIAIEPIHGTLEGSGAARTYTPAAGFAGTDEFVFTAWDGQATSEPAIVTIVISAPSEPPPAASASPDSDAAVPAPAENASETAPERKEGE